MDENNFDTSDLPPTENVEDAVNKKLDHEALIEQGKRVAVHEAHIKILEEKVEKQDHDMRRLRKLLEVWINGS